MNRLWRCWTGVRQHCNSSFDLLCSLGGRSLTHSIKEMTYKKKRDYSLEIESCFTPLHVAPNFYLTLH